MTDPLPRRRPDPGPRLYRYEMRIRTNVGPAVTASFPQPVEGAVVQRHTVRRLAVIRDEGDAVNLAALVQRLTECDVAVLDVRLCRSPEPPTGRAS